MNIGRLQRRRRKRRRERPVGKEGHETAGKRTKSKRKTLKSSR